MTRDIIFQLMSIFKIIIILKILINFSCTDNPFWNDLNLKKSQLNGQVFTTGSNFYHPVLVWDDFSLNLTETDSLGYFSLDLYNVYNDIQSVTGELKIYFYALNYNMDSASVFLTEGSLSKDQLDFSQEGILTKVIRLDKKINVEMNFLSNELNNNDTLHLQYDVEIIEPITVKSYIFSNQNIYFESGLFFSNLLTDEITIYNYSYINEDGSLINDQLKYTDYDVTGNYKWNYVIPIEALSLEMGDYLIKPYYLIVDDFFYRYYNMIDTELYSFKYDVRYLNIPSDIEVDTIHIK